MVQTLILTSKNLINDGNNSTFRYVFPQSVHFKDDYIAVQQVSIYNSVYNITAALGNNTFRYTWVDGTVVNITIVDGNYTINSMNAYLQSVMITNEHFLIDNTTGNYIYFIQMQPNVTAYSVQLNNFPIDSTYTINQGGTTGYSYPTNTTTWSVTKCVAASGGAMTPVVTFTGQGFATWTGFSYPDSYPNSTITSTPAAYSQTAFTYQGQTQSFLSPYSPETTPQPNYLAVCSLVNNTSVIPSQLLYVITIDNTIPIGQLYTNQIANLAFNRIVDGNYKEFQFQFVDINGRSIIFQDPNSAIMLVIRNKNDLMT
jgi:hypothetical protein